MHNCVIIHPLHLALETATRVYDRVMSMTVEVVG